MFLLGCSADVGGVLPAWLSLVDGLDGWLAVVFDVLLFCVELD
ncbi:hypothetical protein [Rhizobium sp. RM]|nr:hypothetical protein [Rhizobium sp. RM]